MENWGEEEKVFKDPVHKYVYVQHPIIWKIIGAREFQRLRRIRQLGTGYLTFHGAEHSRFAHSLGAYELTRKIISRFMRNRYAAWSEEENLVCLCAALLHDIGHAPFSHSVESVFGENHEQRSCEIIMEDTEVHRILCEVSSDFPARVASVIRKTYPQDIVVSLVSSQLDADRMDYLLRDAYMTGVSYGTFDLGRILRVMRPYQGKIVVKESGKHAVEDYLMSRYQMYWQVYFHPVTRSAEILLRNIFLRAQYLYQMRYAFAVLPLSLEKLFLGELTVAYFLMLDECVMQAVFLEWTKEKDRTLADLCQRFLFRKLFSYRIIEDDDKHAVAQMAETLAKAQYDPTYYLHVEHPIDHSYDIYHPDQVKGETPIFLLTDEKKLVEISTQSAIVRSILGEQRGKRHMYFPKL